MHRLGELGIFRFHEEVAAGLCGGGLRLAAGLPPELLSSGLCRTTTIRDVYNWRVKETERMVAIVTELRKLGAEVRGGMAPLGCWHSFGDKGMFLVILQGS